MLEGWLDYHRGTLATKCAGLSADQLREQAVPPSNLSLLGLIRHMTEVERGWFTRALGGEEAQPLYYSKAKPDDDFDDVQNQDPSEAFALWNAECDKSRRQLSRVSSLDETAKRADRTISARWIVTHMIEEYARHNGHADFLRERIDGATGD